MSHRSLRHMPALDGLRGLAVLAVLLFHAEPTWLPGGFLGVSTFFTLSGFLITSLLLAEHEAEGGIALRAFWVRRVRRLLPAALLTLVGVAVAGRLLFPPEATVRLPGDLIATAAYGANWRFISTGTSYADLFAAPSLVQHFWSLAIEEQFYVVFPLLAALLLRWGRRPFVAVVGVGTVASFAMPAPILLAGYSQDRVYYGTDTRAGELLVGVLLAVLWQSDAVRSALDRATRFRTLVAGAGVAALLASIAAWSTVDLSTPLLYRGGLAMYALTSVALVASATLVAGVSPAAWVLGLAPLRWLGAISYGVYLFHWPVFLVLTPERTGLDGIALVAVKLTVTIAIATASAFLVELPIRRQRFVGDGVALAMVPAAFVVVAMLGVWIVPVEPAAGGRIAFADENAAPPELPPVVPAPEQAGGAGGAGGPGDPAEPGAAPTTTGAPPPYEVLVVGTPDTAAVAESLAAHATAVGGMHVTTALAPCGGARADSDVAFTTELDTCSGWVQAWTPAVAADPDIVVVLQPLNHTALMGITDIVLRKDAGAVVDLLTAGGARLVPVTVPGRELQAFDTTVREVAGDAGADSGPVESLDPALPGPGLYDAVLARRPTPPTPAATADQPKKVMIVGDSVASNLGRGLELWGRRTGDAVFWNAAALGCGLVAGGVTNAQPPYDRDTQKCIDWRAGWKGKVDQFDPDVVVVLTGPWDLQDRQLPGWGGFRRIGDAVFDQWLLAEYRAARDVFASGGADVVWLTAPCTGTVWSGFAISGTGAFDNARIDLLDKRILPQVGGIEVVDLHRVACPAGRFTSELGGVKDARPDGLHFIEEAAVFVADRIGPEIVGP